MVMAPAQDLRDAYAGKRVFVTGHTGFKGSWLSAWLHRLGAEVHGYAHAPDTQPALFDLLDVRRLCASHTVADVRDPRALTEALRAARPGFVFHLAAQPLVRRSYERPLETFETNVLGTANLLEAIRAERLRATVVVVTTDKCYENREWAYGYRESDPLGGHDPYSASKAAAELVVTSYRRSFFPPARLGEHGVGLASARAGNVIGGGDWALDRLVPDAIGALVAGRPIPVRNPAAIRPWQHVLEPIGGYLRLGAAIASGAPAMRARCCDAWNFGPQPESARPVRDVVAGLVARWGGSASWEDRSDPGAVHEGGILRLAIDKAISELGWVPRWGFDATLDRTVAWYRGHAEGGGAAARALTLAQIDEYAAAAGGNR
jgi:CDP-glucose 4,6-dehydratase